MKPTTNTPDMLIIDHKPWLIAAGLVIGVLIYLGIGISAMFSDGQFLFGAMFAVIGTLVFGACFTGFVRRVQVIFDRPANAVVHRRRSVWGYTQEVFALDDLIKARIDEHQSDGTTMYRPVLVFENQPDFPIVVAYDNTRMSHRTVDAVNTWLEPLH